MSAELTEKEIRIVLIGKTGVGKSSTGNTILRKGVFHKAASSKSVTKQCRLATTVFKGKPITVVDTPGWCDTELSEDEITHETVKCIDMSCPGPHVFLLILAIGNRFTAEEKNSVLQIQEIFGERATKYTMILFTKGDNLDNTFDDYLKGATEDLKALIAKCDGRCQVFNNRDKSCSQVTKLLENIQNKVQCNGGGCYTNTTYQLLEKYKKREAELRWEADAARREKEAMETELHRLTKMVEMIEEEEQRQRKSVLFMLHQMEIGKRTRRQEEEERIQRALSVQAEEHQRMMDLERQKQKEEQLKHQRHMESEELKRKNEEALHRHRMEMERQRLEKEMQEISKRYEATSHKLEEQKKLTRAEIQKMVKESVRKNKKCVIS